jgi:hypothetical protein
MSRARPDARNGALYPDAWCVFDVTAATSPGDVGSREVMDAGSRRDAAQAHRVVERGIPGEVVLIVDDDLAAALEV